MKVTNYISEAFNELKTNVTWPEWSEVQRLTIIVAVFSIIFALLTFGVDRGFEVIVEKLYTFLNS
ncbi:preprotein translocase subunit SecE [Flavobacterium coralii]|jgi:preprotein translocase subunit SecE|uniref:preprotein translocase subunit SecE n=1 Tax=Flavobacterium coralii TaxID=2838017 RepID=UPI000C69124F|nr:preprotein translocase subunit SecE [Flavobacterium coralii]MBF01187.1 preprotein translocase subunit SecE [Flavobacterium sp.]MBY8962316.1 preprotein translocase subunit SecE [Flavobacterium coralii]|tara:strand:+ start:355 stop:549 length:195 start_codon:yes stop_codon:yes gene_type:complete